MNREITSKDYHDILNMSQAVMKRIATDVSNSNEYAARYPSIPIPFYQAQGKFSSDGVDFIITVTAAYPGTEEYLKSLSVNTEEGEEDD